MALEEWFDQLFEVRGNAVFVFLVLTRVHSPIQLGFVDVTVRVAYWAGDKVVRAVSWLGEGYQLWSDFYDQLVKREVDVRMRVLVEEPWGVNCTTVFFELA